MRKTFPVILIFSIIFLCFQLLAFAKEDSVPIQPDWYRMLPEGFKLLEENKIRAIENLRIRIRASHENCALSIMSTPWAVEKAQYMSLSQAKNLYPQLNERDWWGMVLAARFQIWKASLEEGLEIHENSKLTAQEQLKRIRKLETKIAIFIKSFSSFSDVGKFIICMEEEMGNFSYPSGQSEVLDELNSILGRGRPSKEEMRWYFSILNKIQDEA